MNVHTNIQIINDPLGMPAFVVIPYNEYQTQLATRHLELDDGVPSDVVDLALDNNYSAVRAWREYLGIVDKMVANF